METNDCVLECVRGLGGLTDHARLWLSATYEWQMKIKIREYWQRWWWRDISCWRFTLFWFLRLLLPILYCLYLGLVDICQGFPLTPVVIQPIEHGLDFWVEMSKLLQNTHKSVRQAPMSMRNWGRTRDVLLWTHVPCTQRSRQSQWNHTASSVARRHGFCPSWAKVEK